MKAKIKESKTFTPFTLEIEVETEEEFINLCRASDVEDFSGAGSLVLYNVLKQKAQELNITID